MYVFLSSQLYNFFGYLMDHFTPASNESKTIIAYKRLLLMLCQITHCKFQTYQTLFFPPPLKGNLISHIFRENEICRDVEWERYFCYKSIEVPDSYTGPHPTFPMTFCGVSRLVEAFKHKQVGADVHRINGLWHKQHFFFTITILIVCFVFSPVAAPCSICPAAPWRNMETFKNSSKYYSCVHKPHQRDYHMWYTITSLILYTLAQDGYIELNSQQTLKPFTFL